MTYATIYKTSQGEVVGFRTEGHAGCGEAGNDVVCAAVSMLVFNTINSIEEFTEDEFEGEANEEQALVSFMAGSERSNETKVLLKSLELGLTQVAQGNPDYLSITIEEV